MEQRRSAEFLRSVLEDLEDISAFWKQPDLTEAAMRRESTTLRRLLADGDLLKAWTEVRGRVEYTIEALHLEDTFQGDMASVKLLTVGGGRIKGLYIAGFQEWSRALTPAEISALYSKGPPTNRKMSVNKFVESTCLIYEGTSYKREELIRYVANKLGGAHYDEDRTEKQLLLDTASSQYNLAERPLIYFELLSTAQFLVSSPDTILLIQQLKKLA